ncbi:N-acetylglucosamine-6-phosphate deacetylase [Sphingobium sp. H39-3-25]|uniref:N-acetylglucosamine-6-phosphate deacetylase n=1 Tax=Sphingobium arseniciresistens TaxID=3030834 RepID=UPI0023B88CE4|nr:N-acetylglucosamine-6-phosphate deacetylase [Sphingobium arseniciresistens]
MKQGFRNGTIVAQDGIHDQLTFEIEAGRIVGTDAGVDAENVLDLDGGWLVSGFIDVQVNGGGGVLFNDTPDVQAIAQIGAAHAQYGTTAFLPTLISGTLDVIERALDAVDAAIEQGVPGVIGIHVEGPFLNADRKGIHNAGNFRALDEGALALLTRPRRGVVMVTLAPERNDVEAIRALTKAGVIVSIGHSNATYAEARSAIDAGATGITHLYNAMSPLHHREPGLVGAAMEDGSLYCGLIIDGAHVHPAALRIAFAARPRDRFMLVTDAMPTVGSATKTFVLNGEQITVQNGVCVNAAGTLAGCDLDMAQAVRNTRALGISMTETLAMASANPAAFLGLSERFGALAPGFQADYVWLDSELKVRGTWIGGQRVA